MLCRLETMPVRKLLKDKNNGSEVTEEELKQNITICKALFQQCILYAMRREEYNRQLQWGLGREDNRIVVIEIVLIVQGKSDICLGV